MGYLSVVFNKFHQNRDIDILNEFRERLWKSLPYEKLNRKYTYRVSNEIEDYEVKNKLKEFSHIDYKVLKSRYRRDELISEEYIKARINSNYGKYFDKEIYLGKQYYFHLANYKNIYFSYINGERTDVLKEIEDNTNKINKLKTDAENKKINMSWDEYKELINGIIPKIFDNYIPMDKKIEEGTWKPNNNFEWDEDNYIISYFNKCLDGEIKSYIRRVKRKWNSNRKNCEVCGKEIIIVSKYDGSTKYCDKCKTKVELELTKKRVRRYRENMLRKLSS